MMKHFSPLVIAVFLLAGCVEKEPPLEPVAHKLSFDDLPATWDEGMPLGNGMLGLLVWEKEGKLRFSLDRADLWDLRPMENLNTPKWNFDWVYEKWENDQYHEVQDQFDRPYNQLPAPTKIPAGALEFDLAGSDSLKYIELGLGTAVCAAEWEDGRNMQTFVHGASPVGWFRFTGFGDDFAPVLVPPEYQSDEMEREAINSLTGQNLHRLGYSQGKVEKAGNSITYTQEGWGGFVYQIHVSWTRQGNDLIGCWSISSDFPGWESKPEAAAVVSDAMGAEFNAAMTNHMDWWNHYWQQSRVSLPDSVLEKQWYLEMYKFGSAARQDAPPISLQAVWTADNGKIPPWKGDFHHDLNTQLSYWPAYSGNHLDLETGFLRWLWKYRDTFKSYTKTFYGTEGLNVPGVSTLTGEPMGGWIQYSFGPTVSAWLGHHFYLHWRYSMDTAFLHEKAYPWIRDVAMHLEQLSVRDENGFRKLPLSSSPEIFNNSRQAWFDKTTNFDLALIRWTFSKASELAGVLDLKSESEHWKTVLDGWPDFVYGRSGLHFAPGVPYAESHRHFSHLMAFHPLGLIDWYNGEDDRDIIRNTLHRLDSVGPDHWTGYSWSWLGNLKARAMDGDGAVEALRIFSEAFCLPNSFHVNGDQSGKGYSTMTYRPFTLEGNFAFASGIQEMLLQSHSGIVRIFPAIPDDWTDVSFRRLRAEGAFLVDAWVEEGNVTMVVIRSEKGGPFVVQNPFDTDQIDGGKAALTVLGDLIKVDMDPGQIVRLQPAE
jgi:alpha-L-fucosidase 2